MARSVGRARGGGSHKNNRAQASSKNSGAGKGAPTTPSRTLSSILSDLKLSYNDALGTLAGDAVRAPPRLDVLNALKKSLVLLKGQLEKCEAEDSSLLEKIELNLSSLHESAEEAESSAEGQDAPKGVKRSADGREIAVDDASGGKSAEEMSEANVASEDGADGDGEGNDEDGDGAREQEDEEEDEDEEDEALRPKKKRSKIKAETEPLGEDAKDEDDIPLAAVRKGTNGTIPAEMATEDADAGKKDQQFKHEDDNDDDDDDDGDNKEEPEEEFHTPESDTRVKNPKSEFVTSQTLPAAAKALGLFSEETGGLDQTGTDYLKRKYAVASYPTRDLKDMLAGPIPNVDFSKSKPSNQIQFTTFQSYTDVYFRPFSEDDIKFLKEKFVVSPLLGKYYDPALHPFLIPKLGPLYADAWAHEEPLSGVKLSTPAAQQVVADSVIPKGTSDALTDESLESDSISCGPLVTRLLSALIPDAGDGDKKEVNDAADDDAGNGHDNGVSGSSSSLEDQQGWNATVVKTDYSQLEQRLRRELKYVGVYMNVSQSLKEKKARLTGAGAGDANSNGNGNGSVSMDSDSRIKDEFQEDWISGREDDEICAEIRALQRELSQLNKKNNMRKQILIPLVEEQIAWQEYMSILDDLDKQIDQAYSKRMRVPKKAKKRGHAAAAQAPALTPSALAAQQAQQAQQAAANSGLKSLLDKRLRWINKIGPLFKPTELMRRIPADSVFKDLDLNKEEEENEEMDDGTIGIKSSVGNGEELIDDDEPES